MQGFAEMLLSERFTPGFKVNTDAKFRFDRGYSGGMQAARDVFEKCLIWAVDRAFRNLNVRPRRISFIRMNGFRLLLPALPETILPFGSTVRIVILFVMMPEMKTLSM